MTLSTKPSYVVGSSFKILAFVYCLLLLLQGCASSTASYHFTQKQIEHGDLGFHERLRVDEYINAFPQDEIKVPEGEDVLLRIDPFTRQQPAGNNRTLFQIAIKTRMPHPEELRTPLSLCFVVDVSGSMGRGNKIGDVKEALAESIAELQEGDEVSIVLFSDEARVLVPAQELGRESRKSIIEIINRIEEGGGTNIEAGLITGYREMAAFKRRGFRRLLLLTDGQSNVGVLTPEQLAAKAEVEYLEDLRISTIGLGFDVDERLLRKIASGGSGHYYFVENAKALTTILREELGTTVIPLLKNVSITISAEDNFRLLEAYGGSGQPKPVNNKVIVNVGELNVNDWRIIIVELEGNVGPGTYHPVNAEVSFTRVDSREQEVLSENGSIDWQTAAQPAESNIDINVARNSVLFGNAMALIKVGEFSEQGRYSDALNIVDLQINNNRVIQQFDETGSLNKEIESLSGVRNILMKLVDGSTVQPVEGRISQTSSEAPMQIEETEYSPLKSLVISGLKIAAKALPGIWGTIANLFVAAIE